MFKQIKIKYFFILICVFFNFFTNAQNIQEKEKPETITRILFIFDASQSMFGEWQSDVKINIARELLSDLLDSLQNIKNIELALRVYGHQYDFRVKQNCNDTKLEVPFAKNNVIKIKNKLKSIVPKGTTPIARSLEMAGSDFPPCSNCRNIIILITDGIEECDGDPCAISAALQKGGIVLQPFIIGIGKNFEDAFDCVGKYFDASEEKAFRESLNIVISQTLNPTTLHVNLLDINKNPTETNVNMTFYDNYSGLIKYNFIHTLNSKGNPDMLTVDPLLNYDIVVHTIPPVGIDSVVLTPGKHNIVGIDAPQGYLKLKFESSGSIIKNLPCIVRENDKTETMNVQYFDQLEKYITGIYDLEILCLPRLIIENVEIKQSHTTDVIIHVPGIANIYTNNNGYGSIYIESKDKLKWIYNLRDNLNTESLVLQPGNYKVVFRTKHSYRSFYTVEKSFTIKSGMTTNVKMY